MGVEKLQIERFRCLSSVVVEPHPRHNVIIGANGAGKTSVLEALFFLGRGRSFRPGKASTIIQTGADDFTVYAELAGATGRARLGAQVSRTGMNVHVDGTAGGTAADLASHFPVQVIDPEVHELVQGGPKTRRSFLDWGVFHVKHDFFPVWRRFRKALQQRNQALRQELPRSAVAVWETELLAAGTQIDVLRRTYMEKFEPVFERVSEQLVGLVGTGHYRSGWPRHQTFEQALESSWKRDLNAGQTHVGPHRAELVLEVDGVAARNRLSRGQQKLLGISLVLAQAQFVAEQLDRNVTLLVDEPAAELDKERLEILFKVLKNTQAQLFITALDREALPLDSSTRVFHVKHGELSILL